MSDDDAAQFWLLMLRDGNVGQKIQAREQLAAIFERRGMLAEAVELLESNVTDGVSTPDIYDWLARLYSAQERPVMAQGAQGTAAALRPQAKAVPVSVGWRANVGCIIGLLVGCWPAGLFFMWSYAPWTRRTKIIITIIAVNPLIFVSFTRASQREVDQEEILRWVVALQMIATLVCVGAFLVIRRVIRRLTAQRMHP